MALHLNPIICASGQFPDIEKLSIWRCSIYIYKACLRNELLSDIPLRVYQ